MALSWNEIKDRAIKFSKEWVGTSNEEADAKPFLVEFFDIFGISSRKVATFEHRVKKLDDHDGYIDMFWKGMMLVEMKSRGKNLDKAYQQAKDYIDGLKQYEIPKYILVSDFENFRLYDIDENTNHQFTLSQLVQNVQHFGFIAGYQKRTYKEQDPVNIKAAELMGKLHDKLEEAGYKGHALEAYLVRLLFCLFADDTTIFEPNSFQQFIEQRTSEDGSDLGARLNELFYVLNTPKENRLKTLDEQLNNFPYVNGKLFEEPLPPAAFDSGMRRNLLDCCGLDWGKISPAIFGSMFQSVMNPTERRNLGAHYTSEKNILKLIKPLFLDELWAEFETLKGNKNKLLQFHKKISELKFLDPACGCGNFLVITYRELRLLEIEILRQLNKTGQGFLNVGDIIWLDVDMMCGIEYEEFPAQIAQVAMWLIDHQMNMMVSQEFGQYFVRLPLKKSANILHADALATDWQTLLNPVNTYEASAEHTNIYIASEPTPEYKTLNIKTKSVKIHHIKENEKLPETQRIYFDYIIGNPPFIGKSLQNENQKEGMERVFAGVKGAGVLDYVAAWYLKAAQLIQNTKTKAAFVSTNSITQGEQTGVLWGVLFSKYKIKIHFAHRTFSWNNEAKGNAAVHVVIIGFANFDTHKKIIYEYQDIKDEPQAINVKNINPYLVDAKDVVVMAQSKPVCSVPKMIYGNKIVDGGHYLFTEEEKNEFVYREPYSINFFKPILSGDEFINGQKRWVLYLANARPEEIKSHKLILSRVEYVANYRAESKKEQTRFLAKTPLLFAEPRQPQSDFLLFPRTSSENRSFLPLGFFTKDYIVNDSCIALPEAKLYHFGVLSSTMHMAWVKHVAGRLKSDFRYSNTIVYNNFPWPENPSEKQIQAVEKAAQEVLDVRAQYPDSSLADLYDPLTMPAPLVKAHQQLDKAVDLCYRSQPFTSEAKRMEFLFDLYEKYTSNLFSKEKVKKSRKTTSK